MELDAERNTNSLRRNIYTGNIQWNKTESAHNQDEQMEKELT